MLAILVETVEKTLARSLMVSVMNVAIVGSLKEVPSMDLVAGEVDLVMPIVAEREEAEADTVVGAVSALVLFSDPVEFLGAEE